MSAHRSSLDHGDADRLERTLDPGIREIVKTLREHGVETFESCEGGPGHAFAEPTVRFAGGEGAGMHALGVCADFNLPASELNREWSVRKGQVFEVCWTLVFNFGDHRERKKRWNR